MRVNVENIAGSFRDRVRPFGPKLFFGPRPTSPRDVEVLSALEVVTIVNAEGGVIELMTGNYLREQRWSKEHGLKMLRLTMPGFAPPTQELLAEALGLLGDPTRTPLYLHDRSGRGRALFLVAAYRVGVQRVPPEVAYQEIRKKGFRAFGWKHTLTRLATHR